MSQAASQPLALKWRPKVFADMVGQEAVTRTLQNAVKSGRVAHAYIFSGPRGVGKTTTARLFAKVLSCRNPADGEPCNACDLCEEINRGSSLDVIEIDAASFNRIEDIRNLQEQVGTSPAKAKYKVYIFDEAHRITPQAFDAFLKTLEEPPPHVLFILASTEIHKFPPTVQSRCQRLEFRAMGLDVLVRQLERIAKAEGIEADPAALHLIARSAGGSMRDAQRTLDQIAAYSGTSIGLAEVRRVLGLVEGETLVQLARAAADGDAAAGLTLVRQAAESGKDLNHFHAGLLETFRHLSVARVFGDRADPLLPLPEAEKAAVRELAPRLSDAFLLSGLRLLIDQEWALRRSSNPQVVLETLVYELCRLTSLICVEEALAGNAGAGRPGAAEAPPPAHSRGEGEPVLAVEEIEEPGEGSDTPELSRIKSQWREVLERVGQEKKSLMGVLLDVRPKSFDRGTLVAACKGAFHLEQVGKRENKEVLEAALRDVTGIEANVVPVLAEEAPRARPANGGKAVPRPLAKSAVDTAALEREEPLVKAVVELFQGKVVEVKKSKP